MEREKIIATVPAGFRPLVACIGTVARKNGELAAVYNIHSTGNLVIYGEIDDVEIAVSGAYICE